jgi:hypothetical protein
VRFLPGKGRRRRSRIFLNKKFGSSASVRSFVSNRPFTNRTCSERRLVAPASLNCSRISAGEGTNARDKLVRRKPGARSRDGFFQCAQRVGEDIKFLRIAPTAFL